MGKLKASLYSFGARGRLGGSRQAPGALLAEVGPVWHKDLLGLDAHDHPHYARHAANEEITGQWRFPLTPGIRFGGVAGPTLSGHATGDTLFLAGAQQVSDVLSVKSSTVDPSKWLNVSPVTPSGNVMWGITLNPSNPQLTGANAIFYGLVGLPIASLPSGSSGAILQGLNFMAGLGGGGGGAVAANLSCIYTRLAAVAFGGTITRMAHLAAAAPLIFGGAPSVTEYVGLDLADMGKHGSIVDSYGLRIANMTLNTGVRRLLELGPTSPFLRLVGGAVPPANTSHLWLDFGGTLRRLSRNGATGVLSAF